ncbi:hypothetical protein GCM10025865_05440 [Paraoerskovia sediminicola]|uniref:WXG100 family type VII secretion target n=1 Tax=Paraoerskovia sediminicola TaxID=1138587 RepID=A0ABN6X8U5_9CELL|nr:WXG100 family type VII secretion target [Paraoerskovia sediminicola]BDZ41245.1 hypothetical protein GCM10025865_05440 [Paraoerskovia sediminicola]
MANMNVTYDEMTSAADRLAAGQQDLTDMLEQLKAQVNDLVSSGFVTDQASGAFQASYEEFTGASVQAVSGIESMVSYLKNAAQTLGDVDSQLAAGIRG